MFGLRLSSAATSLFLRPATTSSTIRRSVSESSPSEAVRPPIRRSSERALSNQTRAPSRSKIPTARCSDLAGGALVLRPALHRPEREERAGELERVHSLRRLGRERRRLERSDRPLVIALCGEEKSAAAEDERAESRVTVRCASIDLREQPLRLAKVAGRKQSLDPGRARQLGEVPVQLLDVVEERARRAASSRRHRRRRARGPRVRSAGGRRPI